MEERVNAEWIVSVRPPKKREGSSLYLRARCTVAGERLEQVSTADTTDHALAEERAREWQVVLRAQAAGRVAGPTPIALLDVRLEALERTKAPEGTLERTRGARKRLAPYLLEPASKTTRAVLLRAQDSLRERGLAHHTINTDFGTMLAAWRWAEERGLVADAPPRIRALKGPRTKKRPGTDAEVVSILGWVREHRSWAHPILELVADGGRRISSICELKEADVLREANELHIRTKGQLEAVPVSPEVMALVPRAPTPDGYVFPQRGRSGRSAPDHTRHVLRRSVLGAFDAAVAALKIPDGDRLDVHSLRRSWCAASDRAGVSIDVGRRVTGHKTRAMFEHYQAGYAGDNLHEAVKAVRGRRWGSPPPPLPQRDSQAKPVVGLEPTTSSLRITHEEASGKGFCGESGEARPDNGAEPREAPVVRLGEATALEARAATLLRVDPELVAGLLFDEALVRGARLVLLSSRPDLVPQQEAPARQVGAL